VSFIVAVLANLPPITEISLNDDQALRVYPQIAYPFCIQQYRNYVTGFFRYSVNLGCPEGLPLLQFALQEDQSHFIHYQHYLSGLDLGLILLLGMVALVGSLYLLERKVVIERKQSKGSTFLLISVQVILIMLISVLYLSGNIIYPIGGMFILLVTLYPTYRAIRS
jgi:hypothetical protein